jgi:hypothetical protein
VDRSLYSPVQPHYTAAPLFDPPSLDPVPQRSGIWWRFAPAVAVPELPEPAPPPTPDPVRPGDVHSLSRRAAAYAEAALRAVATAPTGERHPTLMAVAVRLYSLAGRGLLDPAEITAHLLAAAQQPLSAAERRIRCTQRGTRSSANEDALDWARAKAAAAPDLPEGF